jgi:hypothetical protein
VQYVTVPIFAQWLCENDPTVPEMLFKALLSGSKSGRRTRGVKRFLRTAPARRSSAANGILLNSLRKGRTTLSIIKVNWSDLAERKLAEGMDGVSV